MSDWIDPDANRTYRTVVPPPLLDRYNRALGAFMHAFACLEDSANLAVKMYLSRTIFEETEDFRGPDVTAEKKAQNARNGKLWVLRDAMIRALPAYSSFETLRSTIKRFLRITNEPASIVEEIDYVFNQIAEIQFMRNRLAHNPAFLDQRNKEDWFELNNRNSVLEERLWEVIYFQIPTLEAMERDLRVAMYRMSDALYVSPDGSRGTATSEADRQSPWHYKPSLLRREGPKHQPNPR